MRKHLFIILSILFISFGCYYAAGEQLDRIIAATFITGALFFASEVFRPSTAY